MSRCVRCDIHEQFDGVSGKPADELCTICRADDAHEDGGAVVFVVFYRSGGFVVCASPEAAARLMTAESPDAKDEIDAWLAALPTDEHDEWSLVTDFYTVCRAPVEGP